MPGLPDLDIISILKLGLPGLVFLIMLMSFRLIANEQKKEKPNPATFKVIRTFVYVNVFLAILTIAAPLLERFYPNSAVAAQGLTYQAFKLSKIERGTVEVCSNSKYVNNFMLLRNLNGTPNDGIVEVKTTKTMPCQDNDNSMRISSIDARDLGWPSTSKEAKLLVDVAAEGYKFDR